MTQLVQIKNSSSRRVAIVEEPYLRLLRECDSIYALAQVAIAGNTTISDTARQRVTDDRLDYDPIYAGESEWRILAPIDHPDDPARCMISGTGLTHLGSAKDRQTMHAVLTEELTDSMKMFRWGVKGGRPASGSVGTAPEWFYKGTGTMLRAHNEQLDIPPHAEDGGEEAEIAGIYLIDSGGRPRRIGMAAGNEFSDHRFEKRNYLNLAGSKLRTCALGPELVTNPQFQSVTGEVSIQRAAAVLWSKAIRTGEAEMCHSLQNIEHHHFKFEAHRRPGDVHVHFMGADCLSFGEGIELADGDVMNIKFAGFGRALSNPVKAAKESAELIRVIPLR